MGEEDLKLVISKYQQKVFELFNQNIVLETQIEKLTAAVNSLNGELEKLKVSKTRKKTEGDFE
jgi:DnaJ-class molecular chaperone